MRAMVWVAVLVLAGCGGEGGGEGEGDDGAGGMGGAPGAGGAAAAVDPLTAIRECQEVEGEAPCCPDPADRMPLGGLDGMTLQCNAPGATLEDSTNPYGVRRQRCDGSQNGRFSITFYPPSDDDEGGALVFGEHVDDALTTGCDVTTGRLRYVARRAGDLGSQCTLEYHLEGEPPIPYCQ